MPAVKKTDKTDKTHPGQTGGLQTDELCAHLESRPCHGLMLLHHRLPLADRFMPDALLSAQHHASRNAQPVVTMAKKK